MYNDEPGSNMHYKLIQYLIVFFFSVAFLIYIYVHFYQIYWCFFLLRRTSQPHDKHFQNFSTKFKQGHNHWSFYLINSYWDYNVEIS